MNEETVKYHYVSPVALKARRYNKSKRAGIFKFGCDETINNFIAAIFAEEERKGAILSITARGRTNLPEFCIVNSDELLAKLETINQDVMAKKCLVSIELRL